MLSAPPEELRRRAEALAEALSPLHPCTAVETQGEVGGGARPGESLPAWAAALELPNVRGLVVGRSLLYPGNDDVEAAVDAAVALL